MSFAVDDAVLWSLSGTEDGGRPATITAVDTRTDPATYIIVFENGEKKGSRAVNLQKNPAGAAPKKESNLKFMKGVKGLFGSVTETVKGIASTAKSTVASAAASRKHTDPSTDPTISSVDEPAATGEKAQRREKTEKLIAMGFDPQHSEAAIILSDGDMNQALAILSEQCGNGDDHSADTTSDTYEESEEHQQHPQEQQQQQQPPQEQQPLQEQQQPASVNTNGRSDAFDFFDAPLPTQQTQPPPPAFSASKQLSTDNTFESISPSTVSPVVASPSKASNADAFDFLSDPAPASVSSSSPVTVIESNGNPLSLISAAAGCIKLRFKKSDLPWCPEATAKVSVAVKSSAAKTWKHVVDYRTSRLVEFASAEPWSVTSHPDTTTEVVIFIGNSLTGSSFDICCRAVWAGGAGSPGRVLTVELPEEQSLTGNDIDSFLGGSLSPTPASPSRRKQYATHARGEIYDID